MTTPFKQTSIFLFVLLVSTLGSYGLATGQVVKNWIDPSGGSFQDSGNWDTGVPGGANQARFALDAGYNVDLTSSVTNQLLTVIDGDVRMDGSAGSTVQYNLGIAVVSGGNLQFGARNRANESMTGSGQLVIQNGGFFGINKAPVSFENQSTIVGAGSAGGLSLSNGAILQSANSFVGSGTGSVGFATVRGNDSVWQSQSMTIGDNGEGELEVLEGGQVTVSRRFDIGSLGASVGSVTVNGSGSELLGDMRIGAFSGSGRGDLRVENRGLARGNLDLFNGSMLTITGDGSSGQFGRSRISNSDIMIADGGQLDVTADVNLLGSSSVELRNGARFSFHSLQIDDFARIVSVGTGNSLAGRTNTLSGSVTDVGDLTMIGPRRGLDLKDVVLENQGTLFGNAALGTSLVNTVAELQVNAGESMRFLGSGSNTFQSEINLFGGLVSFNGSLRNSSSSFIGGYGTVDANEGIENQGVMAFTGDSNVLGDVTMDIGSQLIVSGFSNTTLFDDLEHNGEEIRVSAGSSLVLLGEATGAGDFTGSGTVFFEGDLRPGNSPDTVRFEGDVVLGNTSATQIELAGEMLGDFDQLLIEGDLDIDGGLSVNLIDGFELSVNQQFLIADVAGTMSGTFDGLSENALVGNFGGHDLFITYKGFDENRGIGLFTAVPEPSGAIVLISLAMIGLAGRRRSKV